MKKLLLATTAAVLCAGIAGAEEIKVGLVLGFTGPVESLVPPMAAGAELAFKEINDSGKLLGGSTITVIRADGTCGDAAAAVAAAERVVTGDGVKAIVGEVCSGATGAMLANVAVPNGILMISPSATSPALSTAPDEGLFFRTSPSDARQGDVMADIILGKSIAAVAVTYTNNDYGKGLAEAFQAAYEAKGGKVTLNVAHEDGKADYSAEVGALAAAGGDALVVVGYVDQGGSGVIRAAIDTGAFSVFVLPDGMISPTIEERFGAELNGSFGQHPGTDSPGAARYGDVVAGAFEAGSPYSGESYDAAALVALAMQAAGSTDSALVKEKVFEVANAPGEMIYPGELGKALEILAAGGDIDYVGASAVELIGPGEASGSYREIAIGDGKITTVGYR